MRQRGPAARAWTPAAGPGLFRARSRGPGNSHIVSGCVTHHRSPWIEMSRKPFRRPSAPLPSSLSLSARVLSVLLFVSPPAVRAQRVLQRWDFSVGKHEWTAAHSVSPLEVRDGLLVVRVSGFDPFIHSSSRNEFALQGNSRQFIRMKARCNSRGSAEFFWAGTTEGEDAGFVAGKEIHFTLHGDGEFHTYNIFPGWEGSITRIRFDPPGGAAARTVVEIASIEILEMPPSPRSRGPKWMFQGTLAGFLPTRDVEQFEIRDDRVVLTGFGAHPGIAIRELDLNADSLSWLCLEGSVDHDTWMTVQWAGPEDNFHPARRKDFVLRAGEPRHAVEMAGTRDWEGPIAKLQLSWSADREPVELTLRRMELATTPTGPANLEIRAVTLDRAFVTAGDEARLLVELRNSGGEPVTGTGPEAWSTTGEKLSVPPIGTLAPGQETTLTAAVPTERLGPVQITVSLPGQPLVHRAELIVTAPLPDQSPPEGVRITAAEAALSTSGWRLRAPASAPGRYGPLFLELNDGDRWRTVATLPAIGTVRLGPARDRCAWTGEAERKGDGLRFVAEVRDGDDKTWTATAVFRPGKAPGLIAVRHTLSTRSGGRVYRFDGPVLRMGDGTFGADKYEALFPGLEYLTADEVSSSNRDIVPPGDLRAVTHPNRICIPLMAVASPRKDLVALLWDNRQRWYRDLAQPSALLATPNLVEGGDPRIPPGSTTVRSSANSLLGLFVPSVPRFVPENGLFAETPVELRPGGSIRLESYLLVRSKGEVLDAIDEWFRLFRPKAPAPPSRSLADRYALSVRALEELLYTEGEGWAGVKNWAPRPDPGTALLYLYLSRALKRPELRSKAIDRMAGFTGFPLSLHLGRVPDSLLQVRGGGQRGLDRRGPEGWVFRPNEKTKSLGRAGDTNVGMAAGSIRRILNAAAVIGDPFLLAEGLKGLEWMRQWRVPRGAQVWEIPLHAPDILASAQACEAYLWAYRLTGDRAWLEDAVYWARTGLPFVYFWQTPEAGLEPMQGGTIPIFGATFYVGSWFGRLVQWCGLEYAKVLLDLARFDDSFDWRRVARDIEISGWRQQREKEDYQGLYPDSWSMITGAISWGLMLGPQRLIHVQLKLDGLAPDGDVRLFRQGTRFISLLGPGRFSQVRAGDASGGEVVGEIAAGSFTLAFRHRLQLHETARLAVVGVSPPSEIKIGNRVLPRVEDLSTAEAGWAWSDRVPCVVIKYPNRSTRPLAFEIRGLEAAPEPEVRTRWSFDEGSDGWAPEHDLAPLLAEDGILRCRPTGTDPFLTTPISRLPAARYDSLVLRCRSLDGGSLQVFWASNEGGFSPARSISAAVPAGGRWTDVILPVGEMTTWRGVIISLRIDPPAGGLEIDEVVLREKP